jgi:cytochrome c-type biogenesis protein CcmE
MVVQNAFQILLTGESTKRSIFYADVVIVKHGTRNVKTNNKKTQKTKKSSNTDPTKKPGGEHRWPRRVDRAQMLTQKLLNQG